MRALLPLVYFLLSLVGCNVLPEHRITTRSDVNGVTTLHAVTTNTATGAEKFSCLVSASRQCHYVLFIERCMKNAKRASPTDSCTTEIVQTFSVAAGTSRTVLLPETDVRQCVAPDRPPVAPACLGS